MLSFELATVLGTAKVDLVRIKAQVARVSRVLPLLSVLGDRCRLWLPPVARAVGWYVAQLLQLLDQALGVGSGRLVLRAVHRLSSWRARALPYLNVAHLVDLALQVVDLLLLNLLLLLLLQLLRQILKQNAVLAQRWLRDDLLLRRHDLVGVRLLRCLPVVDDDHVALVVLVALAQDAVRLQDLAELVGGEARQRQRLTSTLEGGDLRLRHGSRRLLLRLLHDVLRRWPSSVADYDDLLLVARVGQDLLDLGVREADLLETDPSCLLVL